MKGGPTATRGGATRQRRGAMASDRTCSKAEDGGAGAGHPDARAALRAEGREGGGDLGMEAAGRGLEVVGAEAAVGVAELGEDAGRRDEDGGRAEDEAGQVG